MQPEPILRINPTGLRRFLRCQAEWYNYTILKLEKCKAGPSPHRDRGKTFHALMEHALLTYAETGEPYAYGGDLGYMHGREVLADLHDAEHISLDEEESREVFEAARYQLQQLDLSAWEIVRDADGDPLIEADLRVPLSQSKGQVHLQAKVDAVLRHKATGKVWIIDWKSTADAISTGDVAPFIEHDYQLAICREVVKAHGIDADVLALCYMRSKAPEPPPKVYVGTKRESTSVNAAKLACDWATYRATLLERGENPDSEAALKVRDKLKARAFRRWVVDITSPIGHATVMTEVRRIAKRMLALRTEGARPTLQLLQNVRRAGCSRCDYEAWCRAELRTGEPASLLLGTDYLPREGSPLAGCEHFDAPLFEPAAAYVKFAATHGRTIEPHDEFIP